ncbi:HK97 gp10 family phage protein [Exiguobacterium sp. S22-S28]|uniref:HK97 gp10 family phage protein n=1 Tax=Exiguobacterium sp. S22-S28 TaxID=3342768 RepID=UPI00372D171F
MSDFEFKLDDHRLFERFNAQRDQFDGELERIGKLTAFAFLDRVSAVAPVMDGRLRNSLVAAASGSNSGDAIFKVQKIKGIQLVFGTNVEYADWVENGHRQSRRFIPGEWKNDKFEYRPDHDGGMWLTPMTVMGKHFFKNAWHSFESDGQNFINRELEAFFDELL